MIEKARNTKNAKSRVVARKRKSPKGRIIEDKKVRGLAGREPHVKPGKLPRGA